MAKKPDNAWYEQNIDDDIANIVIRLNIKLNDRTEITRDFRPDVEIDYDNLEGQLQEAPSIFSYWAMVLGEQRAVVARIERMVDVKRAFIIQEILEKNDSIPKWKVDELVEVDKSVNTLETRLITAKRTETKLYNIVEALKMKSEHLRSLAGFKRQEMRDA